MEYTLKLGESVAVRRRLFSGQRVIFAGEASPGVYSVVAEWTQMHNSAAYNVYFQKGQHEFPLLGGRMVVISVSRHEIRFSFDRTPGPPAQG
jgi:hypothetical protein